MSAAENTSMVKNIAAIVGFVLLLGIGIWSAIQVIQFVPRLFSSTGTVDTTTTPIDETTIAAQLSTSAAESGEPVTLTWTYNGDTSGLLSFSYACTEGFYFQIAGSPVPCNAPYSIESTATSLEVTPFSAKERVEAPFAVTYTNADGESVRDTKTLVVTNSSIVQATDDDTTGPIEPEQPATPKSSTAASGQATTKPKTTTSQPTTPAVRVPVASNPYGTADLKVEMVAIGAINPYGAFETKSIVHNYARGAAKFKVTNLGDKATGTWYFNAVLPTRGGYPFSSNPQPSLMPGASTEILITFDQLVPGVHTFTVHADPLNYIPERSEYNNSTGQALTVLNY